MSAGPRFWWSGGGTIPRSSLTPSPSWMESVPPGHIEGHQDYVRFSFLPKFGQALREWRRSRRWWAAVVSGRDAARWRSSPPARSRDRVLPVSVLNRSRSAGASRPPIPLLAIAMMVAGLSLCKNCSRRPGRGRCRLHPPSSMSRSQRPSTARRSGFGELGQAVLEGYWLNQEF